MERIVKDLYKSNILKWGRRQNEYTSETSLLNVLELKHRELLDIRVLYSIVLISKKLSKKALGFLKEFRNIAVDWFSPLSDIQQEMHKINGIYTIGHSSWFLAAAFNGIVENMLGDKQETKIGCLTLGCSVGCRQFLSTEGKISLLHPKVDNSTKKTSKYAYKALQTAKYKQYLIPWLLNIKYDAKKTTHLIRSCGKSVMKKYEIFIKEYSVFPGYWTDIHKFIHSARNYNAISAKNLSGLNDLRLILSNFEAYFSSSVESATSAISEIFEETITEANMMHPKHDSSSCFSILHMKTIDGFLLFIDRATIAHSTIFSTAAVLLQLEYEQEPYWDVPTPVGVHAFGVRYSGCLYSKVYGSFSRFQSVKPFVWFISLCYLLGIPPTIVIVTDHVIIPLGFEAERIFSDPTLMVSEIIYELGGRTSKDFLEFRDSCIDTIIRLRKHYSIVSVLLSPILSTEAHKEMVRRWVPSHGGDIDCIDFFLIALSRSAKGTLGFWKVLGY
jgi:hypothetical protein